MTTDTSDPASSLWSATAAPPPATPPLDGDRRADVAIVGGGYTGLSAALHLAERGVDAVVLEAERPGYGASGRNHGQVVPTYYGYNPDDIVAKFGPELGERMNGWVAGSADLVFRLIQRFGIDCDARPVGWLMPVDIPGQMARAQAKTEQWAARGAPAEWLGAERTQALIGSPVYRGAMLQRAGGNLQPLGYARGLARAAQSAGAAVHGESPVTAIARDGTSWRVTTPRGTVTADSVILAANAYGARLWPDLHESFVQFRLFQGATPPLPEDLRRTIMPEGHSFTDARALSRGIRLSPDGRLVTGGFPVLTHDVPGYLRRAVPKRLRDIYPQLGELTLDYLWDGKVAMTHDHLPRYHNPAPGLHVGFGYNGRGVALATAMGRLLAERVRGLPDAEMPLPIGPIRRMPFHGIQVRLARTMIWVYGLKDRLA